ncbi:MAG: flagellar biosynthesis protein FliQ [Alphaproteobacteria bacterium]
MEVNGIIDISREAVFVLLKVSLPILIIALIIGLIISLFQALTQIQEATLTFVPKLVAVFICLLFFSSYIVSTLKAFSERISHQIINIE